MNDYSVNIESLSFAYDKRAVLKNIHLKARRGQVIAIMGSSGCGKTTLLKIISGALRPTEGALPVAGVDVV